MKEKNIKYYEFDFIKINEVKYENEKYLLIGEHINNKEPICPHCNSLNIKNHGQREGKYKDLPIDNKQTFLILNKHVYKCKECKKHFMQNIEELHNRNMTERFFKQVINMSLLTNLSHGLIAKAMFLDEKSVRRYRKQYK